MVDVLQTPWIAIVLGVITGLGLMWLTMLSARFFTPDNADLGMYAVLGGVMGGLVLALALMALYRWVAPGGFIWYGPALVGGFVLGLGVAAFRLLSSTSDTQ